MQYAIHKPQFSTRNFSATTALSWMAKSARVASQRRALAKLSSTELNDIGVTKTQAVHEASKPFWA